MTVASGLNRPYKNVRGAAAFVSKAGAAEKIIEVIAQFLRGELAVARAPPDPAPARGAGAFAPGLVEQADCAQAGAVRQHGASPGT